MRGRGRGKVDERGRRDRGDVRRGSSEKREGKGEKKKKKVVQVQSHVDATTRSFLGPTLTDSELSSRMNTVPFVSSSGSIRDSNTDFSISVRFVLRK